MDSVESEKKSFQETLDELTAKNIDTMKEEFKNLEKLKLYQGETELNYNPRPRRPHFLQVESDGMDVTIISDL